MYVRVTCTHVCVGKLLCYHRLYKDYVLEVSVLAVLGQEVWLQRGEARDFKVMMELGYNISHGRNPLLRPFFYLPMDVFIACEYCSIMIPLT